MVKRKRDLVIFAGPLIFARVKNISFCEGGGYMRKKLITKLSQMYIRTFPPLTPNGNNTIGNVKRTILAWLMSVVGGRKTEEILSETLTEFTDQV